MYSKFALLGYLFIFLLLAACHLSDDAPRIMDATNYTYRVPPELNDNIPVADAASHGIAPDRLVILVNDIRQSHIAGVDSVLVAVNGELILEEYFAGWGRDDIHDLRSATKSLTGLLANQLITENILDSEMSVYQSLDPQYPTIDNWTPAKDQITLQDFMNMSSGLSCNDWFDSSPGNESKMYRHQDWVKFILDLPMVREPSLAFAYCTGGVQVVARLLELSSGLSLDDLAQERLFGPLGISRYQWSRTNTDDVEASGHIYMRSRDMLKIGVVVSNDGVWQGEQLLSTAAIDKLYAPRFEFYGDFWWHGRFSSADMSYPETRAIFASGNGGQQIFVFSDLELIVVFTANNYNQNTPSVLMLEQYILPAVYGL